MTTSDEQSPDSERRDDPEAVEEETPDGTDGASADDESGDEPRNPTPSSLGINVPSMGGEDDDGDDDASIVPSPSEADGASSGGDEAESQEADTDDEGEGRTETLLGHEAPTGLSEDTEQSQEEVPFDDEPEPVDEANEADEADEPASSLEPEDAEADGGAPVDDDPEPDAREEGEVLVGGEDEYEDEPTMISDDFFTGMAQGDDDNGGLPDEDEIHQEGGGGWPDEDEMHQEGGAAHGEASLELDDEEEPDEFDDDYEKTVVSDQMFGGGEAPEPMEMEGGFEEPDEAPVGGSAPTSDPHAEPDASAPASNPHAEPAHSDPHAEPAHSDPHAEPGPEGGGQPDPAPPPEETGPDAQSDQPDEDFSSQKTALFDSPFESDPVCPKLNVLEGPNAGQEFLLNGLRNSIGRGTDNSVVIADEAMSRQHLEIVKNSDDTYSLQDLQSVNGTYVNDKRVEEADLFHGDRIKMGKSVCQFTIPGEQPQRDQSGDRRMVPAGGGEAAAEQSASAPQRAQPPPDADETDWVETWATRITFGAGILSVATIAVIIAFVYGGFFNGSKAAASSAQAARTAYRQGVQAVKKRNWSEARDHFKEAKSKNPELAAVDDQLARLKREKQAKQKLGAARQALDDDQPETALKAAGAVPSDSVYYEDAQALIRRQKREQRIDTLYEEAKASNDEGDREEALSTIGDILQIAPNHGKALALRQQILSEMKREEKEEEEEEAATASRSDGTETRVAARNNGGGGGGGSNDSDDSGSSWLIQDDEGSGSSDGGGGSGGSGGKVVNFQKGFLLYKQEKFDEAIGHFEQAAQQSGGSVSERASSAARNIGQFEKQFNAANRAIEQGQWSKASDHLRSALAADKKVASSGYFSGTITGKLARTTAEQGMTLADSGKHTKAYQLYKQAKQYDGSNSRVRALLRKLEKKAQTLYIKAANKRKTNPGETGSLCRQIMNMLPPSSTQHQKAKTLLGEL
jgi:pSer/pThr/pTyr-binding forkhead associated (FHA) protein/tetratricopeptide (TPR) repeat protein